ncbi:pyridoxamine 5'-phosphate oxidase family protein [Paractinoplanes globisporus]|uniref:Pyridoxamine 5'-phosphate oxidase family protein n=1 Tax=Paractinoplanes globisporus TaxID=113565 RepID=A0ABW6WTZ6_9ACTN|nr:pyridoxamine 5'-phosphate oxidase family protein [Actinoplanes globisporus]
MDDSEREGVLAAMVRRVVDTNRYLTLGTVESSGLPRLTPVYYTHFSYRAFYWVSSPESHHSGNIARRADVSMVIFDSTLPPGSTEAVYLSAVAGEVPAESLASECAVAFQSVANGARPFSPAELSGAADLRLYRADVSSWAVHIRGRHPEFGTGIDTRLSVSPPF